MYDELNRYLLAFSVEMDVGDYWYDVGIIHVSKLLAEFSMDDWNQLLSDIQNKNDAWALRFCEAAGDFSNLGVLLVLLGFMERSDLEVKFSAIESIRSVSNLDGGACEHARELARVMNSGESRVRCVENIKKHARSQGLRIN